MEEISDEMFVKEMRIFWQESLIINRKKFGECIRNYFEGDRAEKIINKLQMKIE